MTSFEQTVVPVTVAIILWASDRLVNNPKIHHIKYVILIAFVLTSYSAMASVIDSGRETFKFFAWQLVGLNLAFDIVVWTMLAIARKKDVM